MAWSGGPPKSVKEPPPPKGGPKLEVGATVRATLASGDCVEGQVYAYDGQLGLAVLSKAGVTPHAHDLRILSTTSVRSVAKLREAPSGYGEEALPQVDYSMLQSRVDQAVKRSKEEIANVNESVDQGVQDLFDALAKMYPCRWDGKDIIVMDEIRIKEPYTFDDCIGGNNFPDALDRIRKQVEANRKRG